MQANLSHASRGFVIALAMFGLGAAAPTATNETPEVMSKVTVSAGVPLTKVAQFEMRERRQAPAAVAHKGFIYIIAGLIKNGTASDSIERFDPRTGRSEIIGHLRSARMWHRAVVFGEKIYVLGGATPSGSDDVTLKASVEIFDLATKTISAGPDMPEPRMQFACVETGGQIFAIGGRDTYGFTATSAVFDIAKNQWRRGAPMMESRAMDGTVVSGGAIVLAGGYDGDSATDAVNVFDPATDAWRTIKPLCNRTSAHSTVFAGNYLFLFGDYEWPDRLLAYNFKTGASDTFTLRYTTARHTAVVAVDDRIYVIGGRAGKRTISLDLIQVFALTQKIAP